MNYWRFGPCILEREPAGNLRGISLSSSLPLWSPIPPAARRTPEPASKSLPLPFDQKLPGNKEHTFIA